MQEHSILSIRAFNFGMAEVSLRKTNEGVIKLQYGDVIFIKKGKVTHHASNRVTDKYNSLYIN